MKKDLKLPCLKKYNVRYTYGSVGPDLFAPVRSVVRKLLSEHLRQLPQIRRVARVILLIGVLGRVKVRRVQHWVDHML